MSEMSRAVVAEHADADDLWLILNEKVCFFMELGSYKISHEYSDNYQLATIN